MVCESHLQLAPDGRYSVTPQHPEDGNKKDQPRSAASAESVAFLLLAGVDGIGQQRDA